MKLRSFKIENYKSLLKITQEDCTDFHSLIGSNSSGKSSVLEAIKLIHIVGGNLPDPETISGGVKDFDSKIIHVNLQIELTNEERFTYLFHFFNIEKSKVDELLKTNALKLVNLQLEISIFGSKFTDKSFENLVVLSGMEIILDDNELFTIIGSQSKNELQIFHLPSTPEKTDLPNTSFRSYLGNGHLMNQSKNFNISNAGVFYGRFILDLKDNLRFITAIRESVKKLKAQHIDDERQLGERGENLATFMSTLRTNDENRFFQVEKYCKAIFPYIEKIRPKSLPGENVLIELSKKNLDYPINLGNDGRGLDQALIVIWKIATSPTGTIWLVDEPEIHLHPGAQKLLYDFFKEETKRGKQIIVATHSMVFIHKSNQEEISVLLNKGGYTELTSLSNIVKAEKEENSSIDIVKDKIYEALGYESRFSLEPTTIVAVEGKTDELVLKAFSKILEDPIDPKTIKFIPMGDKKQAKRFFPILKYAIAKRTLIILDNDYEDPLEIKKSIFKSEENYKSLIKINYPIFKEEDFCFYNEDAYSIEYFLLDPNAIGKINSLNSEKIEEIKKTIDHEFSKPKEKRMKPKDFLSNLWSNQGFGPYNEVKTAEEIAKNTSKEFLRRFHPDIIQIIKKINR